MIIIRPLLLGSLLLAAACGDDNPGLYDTDGDGVLDVDDCSPGDALVYPGADDPWGDIKDSNCDGIDGVDADGDSFPGNEALDDGEHGDLFDCNDANGDVFPSAEDPWGDDADSDCDGADGVDADGDGYAGNAEQGGLLDCDDDNIAVSPGSADPWGDAADSNCDGVDGMDADGDGFPGNQELNDGEHSDVFDCNDANDAVHPGAEELEGDDLDSDCDGYIGPVDHDGDGYTSSDDCDDNDPLIHPDAAERCNGLDDDCDGALPTDELDGDGDGDVACADCDDADAERGGLDGDLDGLTECDGDCDDSLAAVFPGATDPWGDGIDQNCDRVDGTDADGDGAATDAPTGGLLWDCDDTDATLNRSDDDGDGVDTCNGDCDDTDPGRTPGGSEIACDGYDGDCVADPQERDDDGDGQMPCQGDCDDGDPGLHGLDDDGDGLSTCDGDCDDSDAAIFPGQDTWEDPSDGVDTDCDGADATTVAVALTTLRGPTLSQGEAGRSATSVGDLDGDGLDELVVGVPFAPQSSSPWIRGGRLYLVAGTAWSTGGELLLDAIGVQSLMTWSGSENIEYLGTALVRVPDVDGDGLDELAVSSETGQGAVFLTLGSSLAAALATGSPFGWDATYAHQGTGYASDVVCALAGDVTGDGQPDLVVGSPAAVRPGDIYAKGGVFVLSIASMLAVGDATDADAEALIWGLDTSDRLGEQVASLGDLDGDGLDELVVAAPWADELGPGPFIGQLGRTWVLRGSAVQGGGGDLDVDAAAWLEIRGDSSDEKLGIFLAAGGDLDGDDLADLVLGAPDAAGGAGEAHVFLGASLAARAPGSLLLPADADRSLLGAPGEGVGEGVSYVGDLDGDHRDELLVGLDAFPDVAPDADGEGRDGLWLFRGSTLGAGPALGGTDADQLLTGLREDSDLGWSAGPLGDLDGDGQPDLWLGAPGDGPAGSARWHGSVFLVASPW